MEEEIRVKFISIPILLKGIKLKEIHMSVKQLFRKNKFGRMSISDMILMVQRLMVLTSNQDKLMKLILRSNIN